MAKVTKKTPKGIFPLPTTEESIKNIMGSRELRNDYLDKFLVDHEDVFKDWLRDFLSERID